MREWKWKWHGVRWGQGQRRLYEEVLGEGTGLEVLAGLRARIRPYRRAGL